MERGGEAAVKRGALVFRFTGRYVDDGERVFCICTDAPLVGVGSNIDAAYTELRSALRVYMGSLEARGELEAAIAAGKTPCIVTVGSGEVPVRSAAAVTLPDRVDEFYIAAPFTARDGHRSIERDAIPA